MPTRRTPRHRAATNRISERAVHHFRRWRLTGDGYYDLLDALGLPPWTNIEDPDAKCPYDEDHNNFEIWNERRTAESFELFRALKAAAA